MRREKTTTSSVSEKARKKIVKKFTIIVVVFVFMVLSIYAFIRSNKTADIQYYENGSTDYTVSLAKNDFFEEDNLPANNQYIASIINDIDVNFKYNLQMQENISNYSYKYRVEAQTKVIEKTTQNNIYDFSDEIKSEEIVKPEENKFAIDSNIQVDYKKYNNLIKKLVSTYNLDNVECKTTVRLYVDLLDENENVKDTATMAVNIPLNVKTVNIEVENNLDSSEPKTFITKEKSKANRIFILIAIGLFAYGVNSTMKLLKYIKKLFPQEVVYDMEIKKILRNYRPYIQKVNSEFDLSQYSLMEVDTFDDMLEIREITQNPILMVENEDRTKMYFVITTLTTILYVYELTQNNVKAICSKN